jgi:hypothetical protein
MTKTEKLYDDIRRAIIVSATPDDPLSLTDIIGTIELVKFEIAAANSDTQRSGVELEFEDSAL